MKKLCESEIKSFLTLLPAFIGVLLKFCLQGKTGISENLLKVKEKKPKANCTNCI